MPTSLDAVGIFVTSVITLSLKLHHCCTLLFADRAILTSTSPAEAGRSDPGRQVDGTSDHMLSAVIADQPKGDIQVMPLTLPEWAPLLQIVPSQSAASPGVLQNVDG